MDETTKLLIKSLYLKGHSLSEVAFILKNNYDTFYSFEYIRKILKELGVSRRNNSDSSKLIHRKHLPTQKIIEEYKEGSSLRNLAKGYGSSKGTLHKILTENNITIRLNEVSTRAANLIHFKKSFSGNALEKAYLLGFIKGDVAPHIKSKYTLRLVTNTTLQSFVELFTLLFNEYGHVSIHNTKRPNEVQVRIDVDLESFKFLLLKKKSALLTYLTELSHSEFMHFLSGIIDSDGSIMLKKTGDYFQYVIRVYNQDLIFLKLLDQKLLYYGYSSHIDLNGMKGDVRKFGEKLVVYNEDYWNLEISNKADVLRLLKDLHLKHKARLLKKSLIQRVEQSGLKRWDEAKSVINP